MKLALYKAAKGSLLDKAIDIGTGLYGYSHNELVFDRVCNVRGDGAYVCFSASPREGECRFKHIDINSGKWHVIDLTSVTVEQEKLIYDRAKGLVGADYDYYGIFYTYILFWVDKQKDRQWWCSEVAAFLLGWPKFRVHPNDLARHYGAPRQEFSAHFVFRKDY